MGADLSHIISWGLQIAMAILIAVWGRTQKQLDALIAEKAARLEARITETATGHEKMLVLQFAVRDQQLLAIHDRLDKASQKSSDEMSRIMVKTIDIDHRLTVLETRLVRHSP